MGLFSRKKNDGVVNGDIKVGSDEMDAALQKAHEDNERAKRRAAKEASRPKIYSTRAKDAHNPDIGVYKQTVKGNIVNIHRQKIKLVCRLLGITRKRYQRDVKKARRLHGMTEADFQNQVFEIAENKARELAPQ